VLVEAKERNLEVVDATCPLVKRAQEKARQLRDRGYQVLVVGERGHPEVEAILGFAPGAVLVESCEDARAVRLRPRVGVVAQTTQAPSRYREILQLLLEKKYQELRVFNTICKATAERQNAALEVASGTEVMFVLGGHNSANTARLREACREKNVPTFQLEKVEELDPEMLRGKRSIGIAAGASTPESMIAEFLSYLKKMLLEKFGSDSVVVG
jgi:4-hydroxy-3-methylbut-2-enyl diphosphate reductase